MPITIFFCYARKDEALLVELKRHLRSLQWDGLIEIWYDRDISAGTEWQQEISKYLDTAQIILLLVSPDFMNSDYCCSVEMRQAVERHERKEARVIPVILEHVFWQIDPLNKLQALPTDAKPVMSRHWQNKNEALFNITEGIRKVVKELTAQDPSLLPVGTEEAQQQVAQTSLILPIVEPVRTVPPEFFEYQEDAYHSLIRTVQDHGAKEAVLLQYSCHTSLPILRMLVRQGAKVTVFIQHEDTVLPENGPFRSKLQADLIGDTTRNLRSSLGKMLVEPDKLEVYKYRVQASMSAIKIDNQILCMGWCTFEQKRCGDDKANPDDTLDVSCHDRAAVVVYKGTKEFQMLDKTFSLLEKNYREHAEIVPV